MDATSTGHYRTSTVRRDDRTWPPHSHPQAALSVHPPPLITVRVTFILRAPVDRRAMSSAADAKPRRGRVDTIHLRRIIDFPGLFGRRRGRAAGLLAVGGKVGVCFVGGRCGLCDGFDVPFVFLSATSSMGVFPLVAERNTDDFALSARR